MTAQTRRDRRAILVAWAALSATTVLAWLLSPGESQARTTVGKELVAAIVVLGLIKCRLIIHYFMEVRHAPRPLRLATDAWLAVLWLTLLVIYLI
ncbi:prokaryotic cytochrome C oxidase subunit IV family protein [Actinomadura sp. CNU-125]|uniref:cytochrome C oxidase subunit IV family protein n=1 Tax=Actinomadura sp. CNU-125 TaxID=1904961 RepID=UPI00095982CC|nr:cytochrome C oxidase subunit IV family protein [Actinomadura sp. CNU-125]OLT23190.1 prokaryotic cytochrome C oxidase subunit IV family protein [Actinomadura sp. CNU-125]